MHNEGRFSGVIHGAIHFSSWFLRVIFRHRFMVKSPVRDTSTYRIYRKENGALTTYDLGMALSCIGYGLDRNRDWDMEYRKSQRRHISFYRERKEKVRKDSHMQLHT